MPTVATDIPISAQNELPSLLYLDSTGSCGGRVKRRSGDPALPTTSGSVL
jgi:hypothetical protein